MKRSDAPRAHTLSLLQLRRDARAERFNKVLAAAVDEDAPPARPVTRGDCIGGERPCPFVSCRWNLYLDVDEERGSIKLNFPGRDIDEIPETCALDVADRGGATLEEVGALLNITRERTRQIEVAALFQLRAKGVGL